MSTIERLDRAPFQGRAPAIAVCQLLKRFGPITAIADVSFDVWPGTIVSLVGTKGSGKTTVLRTLLGQIEPTSGSAMFGTLRYRDLSQPSRVVGAVLDRETGDRDDSVRAHLTGIARSFDLPVSRVERVLAHVGLSDVAGLRVIDLPRGTCQRVAVAGALLGDPQILVLDEPSTGINPETLRWLRGILREFAAAGNAVLLTANSVSEIERAADELVIIHAGRVVTHAPVAELLAGAARTASLRVLTAHPGALARTLALRGRACVHLGYNTVRVRDITPDELGSLAAAAGIVVLEMVPEHPDLEEVVAAFVEGPFGCGGAVGNDESAGSHRRSTCSASTDTR